MDGFSIFVGVISLVAPFCQIVVGSPTTEAGVAQASGNDGDGKALSATSPNDSLPTRSGTAKTIQLAFSEPKGATITWDVTGPGRFFLISPW